MDATIQQLQHEIAFVLKGLDAIQTQFRPTSRPRASDRWSIQQIIEHLLLSYGRTETALEARIVKRTPTRAKPSALQYIAQYTTIRLGYFPTGRKAPALVTPSAETQPLSGDELTDASIQHLARLDQRCTEAAKLFGDTERCASHMVLGPLSISQWRKFQLIHGEHHLKQIIAIRRGHAI
jgi:hypothetical protein